MKQVYMYLDIDNWSNTKLFILVDLKYIISCVKISDLKLRLTLRNECKPEPWRSD